MSALIAVVRRLRGLFRAGARMPRRRRNCSSIWRWKRRRTCARAWLRVRPADGPRSAGRRRRHTRGRSGTRAVGGRWEDLLRDLGYALRGVRRNPGFTLAAVVSLAIPMGFNTTIAAIVDSLLFQPLPVSRPA